MSRRRSISHRLLDDCIVAWDMLTRHEQREIGVAALIHSMGRSGPTGPAHLDEAAAAAALRLIAQVIAGRADGRHYRRGKPLVGSHPQPDTVACGHGQSSHG